MPQEPDTGSMVDLATGEGILFYFHALPANTERHGSCNAAPASPGNAEDTKNNNS